MLLGKIIGKVTTKEFKFLAQQEVKTFDYVQVYHAFYEFVLCQVIEIEKEGQQTIATCQIIGYKDAKDGQIKKIKIPFQPQTQVLQASDEFISEVITFTDASKGAYIGFLEGKHIPVAIDLEKLLTKHLAVLAKSGSGKSYAMGVLVEEIIKKNIPLLIIDPHGEYSSLQQPNTNKEELEKLALHQLQPQGFSIARYGDMSLDPHVQPLRLSDSLSLQELLSFIPFKLSSAQQGCLYTALQDAPSQQITDILNALHSQESNAKWQVISALEQLEQTGLFSQAPTPYEKIIQPKTCSVIDCKGMDPHLQEIVVAKLFKDIFMLRKQDKIPPFFAVIEEAHNFCPERSFGERIPSKIIRNIASEGRKFGLGLGVVSQRPARVDKSVLSQCSTQIIMKVTNPQDLKAIASSVEGITTATQKEIQDISIGTALLTGICEVPLLVGVRPRQSSHGGRAIEMFEHNTISPQTPPAQKLKKAKEIQQPSTNTKETTQEENSTNQNVLEKISEFAHKEMLLLIKPYLKPEDIMMMSTQPIQEVKTILHPACLLSCSNDKQTFQLLVEQQQGHIVVDVDTFAFPNSTSQNNTFSKNNTNNSANSYNTYNNDNLKGLKTTSPMQDAQGLRRIPDVFSLSKEELEVLHNIFTNKSVSKEQLIQQTTGTYMLDEIITSLHDKEFIICANTKNTKQYSINNDFVFSDIDKLQCPVKPIFQHINYSYKTKEKYSCKEIQGLVGKFAKIQEASQVYIQRFKADYAPKNNEK